MLRARGGVDRGRWGDRGCLGPRGGHWVCWLPQTIGNWLGVVVLVGWTHRLCLDSDSNGLPLWELAHFLPQVAEGSLSILIRVEGDVPEDEGEIEKGASIKVFLTSSSYSPPDLTRK